MPRLRDLVILDVRTSEIFPLLQMSPSLRTLHGFFVLEVENEDRRTAPHVAGSFFQTLPLIALNLEKFYNDVDNNLSHGYIEAFSQFAQLNTLSISSELALDGSALRMLPAMRAFPRDLVCTIDLSRSSAPPLRLFGFQDLMGLHLTGPLDDLTAFINACERALPFGSTNCPVGEPADSLTAICRRCDPALLTFFKADILYAFNANSPPPNCLMQYFELLLASPNLKNVHLWFSRVIPSIRDDGLGRFGAAWPWFSRFTVSHPVIKQDRPLPEAVRPTFSGLIDLARCRPHPEFFRIPRLDASIIPEQDAVLPLGHGLRLLSFDEVVLPSPGSLTHLNLVARVLDHVFPSIELEDTRSVARDN